LIKNGYAWVADNYLEEWCYKRLEQSGEAIYVNGQKVTFKKSEKSRKETANQWFETQDSISYWDDFSKQKIVWGNLNLYASYTLVEGGMFVNAPCPMIVPGNLYLLAVLNSVVGDYFIRSLGVIRNGGYFEYKPMFVEQLPVPVLDLVEQKPFADLALQILEAKKANLKTEKLERELDQMIFELYDLSRDEADYLLLGFNKVELTQVSNLLG
jgi:hypothetical protein